MLLVSSRMTQTSAPSLSPTPAPPPPSTRPFSYCRHCPSTQPLHTDRAQGDIVCTSCGIVAESHIMDEGPEWIEYDQNPDQVAKGLPSMARCGMTPVDESRFLGGLEPTLLSSKPYEGPLSKNSKKRHFSFYEDGTDPVLIARKETKIRQNLAKTNRFLDLFIQRSFEESIRQAKIDMEIRQQQQRKQQEQQQNLKTNPRKRRNSNVDTLSNIGESDGTLQEDKDEDEQENDFTNLASPSIHHFFSEHEVIVQQREDDIRQLQIALHKDKWSLDRAVLLHGTSQDPDYEAVLARYFSSYSCSSSFASSFQSLHHHDWEEEKTQLWKQLDLSQRTASIQLYQASRLLLFAAQLLDLFDSPASTHSSMNHNTQAFHVKNNGPTRYNSVIDKVMDMLCRFVSVKDGFTIRGVAQRLIPQQEHTTTKEIQMSRKELVEEQRGKNKLAQMAALGSALIYLICKDQCIGRSLVDICSTFQKGLQKYDPNYSNPNQNHLKAQSETIQIKPKHCFKAIAEIKEVFPEYAQSISPDSSMSSYTTTSTTTTTAAAAAMVPPLTSSSSPSSRNQQDTIVVSSLELHKEISTTVTLVQHSLRSLQLSTTAIFAITYLTLYWKIQEQKESKVKASLSASSTSSQTPKPMTLIVSFAYLISHAGDVMQRLSSQALQSNLSSSLVAAHTEATEIWSDSSDRTVKDMERKKAPSHPSHCKTNQTTIVPVKSEKNDIRVNFADSSPMENRIGFDVFTHDPVIAESTNKMNSTRAKAIESLHSWNLWRNESPWKRGWDTFEKQSSLSVALSTVQDFYKKNIHPQKQKLLKVLSDLVSDPNGEVKERYDTESLYIACKILGPSEKEKLKMLLKDITLACPLMTIK